MRLHQRLPLLNPSSFLLLSHHPPPHIYIPQRLASHAAQGRANKAAPGPGKRLGAKKTATQLVVPGNIIFRQRGTLWFPGENCGMGRDHTIFAREKGYVVYYSDNSVWRKGRKFIGVVRERGMVLPRGRNEARRRVLGLVGRVVPLSRGDDETAKRDGTESGEEVGTPVTAQTKKKKKKKKKEEEEKLTKLSKRGYMYRETNWDIGRAAERAGVKVIRQRVKKEAEAQAQALGQVPEEKSERKRMGRRVKLGGGKKRG